jgi:cytochrome oxidase Cu insertion factor (SCO1/SenC/PrrC family)
VVLVTFVDSACTDVCPIIVGTLGRALRQLTPRERQEFDALAISVHPHADTPAHVRRFLIQHRALGQLAYLVAPVARMKPIWKSFHVLSASETHDANLHSADVRIFNRNGVWVSNMNVGADLSVANVLHDIRQAFKSRVQPGQNG